MTLSSAIEVPKVLFLPRWSIFKPDVRVRHAIHENDCLGLLYLSVMFSTLRNQAENFFNPFYGIWRVEYTGIEVKLIEYRKIFSCCYECSLRISVEPGLLQSQMKNLNQSLFRNFATESATVTNPKIDQVPTSYRFLFSFVLIKKCRNIKL